MKASADRFAEFHRLYRDFFIVPGAADIMTAIMMQHAGFKAIGTSSVALGLQLGCPGSAAISKEEMIRVVADICRAVALPVSIDLESGYSDNAAGVEDVTREVIRAGVVAFNLEDSDGIPGRGLRPQEEHCERIRAARRGADREGVALFINGRTDPFWNVDGKSMQEKAEESVRRANAYMAAGADGVFISGVKGIPAEIIAFMVERIDGPFSTMLNTNGPTIEELRQMGVRRLTLGGLVARSQAGYVAAALRELLAANDVSLFKKYELPLGELNPLVAPFWAGRG
jgi:2-methylisocitrate lyase-like PEP mutase family enzyme